MPSRSWEKFARLILEAAHEATLAAAVLNASKTANNPNSSRKNIILASTLLASPDLPNRLPAGIVTPTGEWIEHASVVTTGSGCFSRQTPKDLWCNRLRRILKAFPKHRVICVDVPYGQKTQPIDQSQLFLVLDTDKSIATATCGPSKIGLAEFTIVD